MALDEEVRTFEEVMVPVFDILLGRIRELHLCQILLYSYLDMLLYFTRQKEIAKVSPWPPVLHRAGTQCCRQPWSSSASLLERGPVACSLRGGGGTFLPSLGLWLLHI